MSNDNETEVREVVSDDPSLSPEVNRILTEEVREAVGAARVRVPGEKPHVERERHGDHSSIGAFSANRILIAITFFALVVVGAIVALATGSWWAVVLAATVHALGTFVVLTTLASAARQVERRRGWRKLVGDGHDRRDREQRAGRARGAGGARRGAEAERAEEIARAHATVAAAQERLYWVDRLQLDLERWLGSPAGSALVSAGRPAAVHVARAVTLAAARLVRSALR